MGLSLSTRGAGHGEGAGCERSTRYARRAVMRFRGSGGAAASGVVSDRVLGLTSLERDAEVDRALDDRVGAAGDRLVVGDLAAAAGLERDPLVGELAADVEVLGQRDDERAFEAQAARADRAEPVDR